MANTWADETVLAFVLDMNARVTVYLRDLYGDPAGDANDLIARYLASQTGQMNARFLKLEQDATNAMD